MRWRTPTGAGGRGLPAGGCGARGSGGACAGPLKKKGEKAFQDFLTQKNMQENGPRAHAKKMSKNVLKIF